MTCSDVIKLMSHYCRSALAVVLACALAGAVLGCAMAEKAKSEYSTSSVLTIVDPTGTVSATELLALVQATAANVIADAQDEKAGIVVTCEVNVADRSLTFTACAPDAETSANTANDVASRTMTVTRATLQSVAQDCQAAIEANVGVFGSNETFILEDSASIAALQNIIMTINEASWRASSDDGIITLAKFTIVGLLGGVCASICVIILIDLRKKPILGKEELERYIDSPIFLVEHGEGERLWTDIMLAENRIPESLCLIPSGVADTDRIKNDLINTIDSACSLFRKSQLRQGTNNCPKEFAVHVVDCLPLEESINSAFVARDADAVLVCCVQWKDSRKRLIATLKKLKIAHANVVGVALIE